jgi:hypothetical protein
VVRPDDALDGSKEHPNGSTGVAARVWVYAMKQIVQRAKK